MLRFTPSAVAVAAALCALSAAPSIVEAQRPAGSAPGDAQTGALEGVVIAAESDEPLRDARVAIEGLDAGAFTDAAGRFRLADLPAGRHLLSVEMIGRQPAEREVVIRAGDTAAVRVALEPRALGLGEMIVTATREARRLAETSATVDAVGAEEIARSHASHPSELMDDIPGVWVNTTGGEGHMTAIRQPLTTNPVYLYLEDGVPTRSTGFFNHNALYEVNVPQAGRVEVLKGPSSSLYGSDAIGGVINVSTRPAWTDPGVSVSVEGGGHGWARLLASGAYIPGAGSDAASAAGASPGAGTGVRADLNLTRTDGWRTGTAYDRQSATVRWDQALDGGGASPSATSSSLKSVLSVSRVDQNTAGSSRLDAEDFRERPTLNYTPVSYRHVRAARLSVEYERTTPDWRFAFTPFARSNAMEMIPNWSLTYDPTLQETSNRSLGVLAQARRSFERYDARLIVGLDVDWSPGQRHERAIEPETDDDGAFVDHSRGPVIYDYDIRFVGVSPYARVEAAPVDALSLRAGLRLDRVGYRYENGLGTLQAGPHRRPPSTTVDYTHLSPKLGATYEIGPGTSVFAAYGRGFRVPSEGQLFRQGVAENTVGLEPVEANNLEAGARVLLGERIGLQLSAYRMVKTNDILDFRRADDTRETQNAGETLHRGIETGLSADLGRGLRADIAFSYARHTYERWRPARDVDYGGREMESAPRTIGNVSLTWTPEPLPEASFALEWTHAGGYRLDPANTQRYDGHDLLGFRANVPIGQGFGAFLRVRNLTDARYAETAGYSAFRGRELAPGLPRTFYLGLEYDGEGW